MADASVVFTTDIDESGVSRGLDRLKGAITGATGGLNVMLGTLAAGAANRIISGAVSYVTGAIEAASNLAEVQNVVDVTFGEGAARINEWATAAKEAYGLGELKAKQFTSTMGAMLKSMGLTQEQTLDMSEGIAGLAGDMASFYNLGHDEAFEKIRSGISGETEPLKQLGINMSVANLQAYALSKGITKSYDSMTQAEQATLRYGYLMQTTADAQGDFARTSDGYANQQRILATTMEELSATVGELLLPVVTAAAKALNNLVGWVGSAVKGIANLFNPPKSELEQQFADAQAAAESLGAAVASAGKNLDTGLASAKATQATALSLLRNYEQIQSKGVLTEQDTAQLRSIANQIVRLYPSMGDAVDGTTGLFRQNTSAVKDNIAALAEQQRAASYYAATQEYQAALVQATVVQQQAQTAYTAAWNDWQNKNTFAEYVSTMRDALIAGGYNQSVLEQYAGQLKALSPAFDEFFQVADDGSLKLTDIAARSTMTASTIAHTLNTQVAWYSGIAYTANENTVALGKTLEQANIAAKDAGDAMEGASEAYAACGAAMEPPKLAAEELAEANQRGVRHFHAVTKEMQGERDEATKLRAALQKLNDDTLAQIEAQINGFERIKKVRPKSAKTTVADVNSQTKFLDDFAANFQKAKDKGITPEALQALSDVNTENAAILAGLANAKDSEIASFNAAYADRVATAEEVATMLAGFQTDLNNANALLVGATEAAQGNAVAATAQTAAAGMQAAAADGKAAVGAITQSVRDGVSTLATGAQTAIEGASGSLIAAGEAAAGDVQTGFEDGVSGLGTAGAALAGAVAGGVQKDTAVKRAVQVNIAGATSSAASAARTGGNSVGSNIVAGINAGLNGGLSLLTGTMRTIVFKLLAAAQAAADSHSPSRLFRDKLGVYLAQGIGVGFSDTMDGNVIPAVQRSVTDAAAEAQKAIGGTLLARVQNITGLGLPSVGMLGNAAVGGAAASIAVQQAAAAGGTVINYEQNITFAGQMQAPDEVARAIRRQATYGLAGARP